MHEQDALFDRCLDTLYASAADAGGLSQALEAVRQFTDAASATFASLDREGRARDILCVGLDPAMRRTWVDYYSTLDPRRAKVVHSRPGEWVADDELLHPARSPSREYANDFARPAGLRWSRGGKVYEGPRGSATLCVQRPDDARPFTPEVLNRLQRLLPHLQRALRLSFGLAERLQGLTSAALALDAVRASFCVVDAEARLVYCNASGEQLLVEANALRLQQGRLQPRAAGSLEAWHQALTRACAPAGRQATSLSVRCVAAPVGAPAQLWLRILPLPEAHGVSLLPSQRLALVILELGQRSVSGPELGAWFGLTNAEADLVQLLAQGHDAAACARLRGVRLSTVRSQIASVLGKTGTGSQAQLMALLSSFTPLR